MKKREYFTQQNVIDVQKKTHISAGKTTSMTKHVQNVSYNNECIVKS